MWAIILLTVCLADDCDLSNDITVEGGLILNSDCNYVGVCYEDIGVEDNGVNKCFCCDSLISPCGDDFPYGVFSGSTCKETKYYSEVTIGYLIQGEGVTCANDGSSPAVPNMVNQTLSVLEGFKGIIVPLPCQICTEGNPCELAEGPDATSGIFVQFGIDLNTHYDRGCGRDTLPGSNLRACDANVNFGIVALLEIRKGIDYDNELRGGIKNITEVMGFGSGELSGTSVERISYKEEAAIVETIRNTLLTRVPSPEPTATPTVPPTVPPTDVAQRTDICRKYSNDVSDLHFMSSGSSCRGSINESWPGGQTCESPYIICLPMENTPAMPFLGREYYNDTHRYTVNQCIQECAYDQRCLGIEFVADANSPLGDCNLIDDIPIEVVDPNYDYYYTPDSKDYINTNLDNSSTGRNALCFEKTAYCNPYFESEDLNDTMLSCYCPDNRKGSYTKKVRRTVNNTRFCDNDSSVDERIRKAQANRMFHLCENWCLFNTLKPVQESWYWDPWKTCWRETYSGRGAHRAYCDRVIRNPDSIELKFINARSENILSCNGTETPTKSPVEDINVTYILSEMVESCDEACSNNNMVCAANQTARVYSTVTELVNVFAEAGVTCLLENVYMNRTFWDGWALPGLGYRKICANRQPPLSHLEDLDSDCHRKIGAGWQRLCACY